MDEGLTRPGADESIGTLGVFWAEDQMIIFQDIVVQADRVAMVVTLSLVLAVPVKMLVGRFAEVELVD